MFDEIEDNKQMINGWRSKATIYNELNEIMDKTKAEYGKKFIKALFMDEIIRLGVRAMIGEDHPELAPAQPPATVKPKKAPVKRFVAPTLEEVESFMLRETGIPGISKTESEKFVDYYKGNGWKAGQNKMKDWEATARNWLRRSVKDAVKKVDRLATPDRTELFSDMGVGEEAPFYNPLAISGD